MIGSNILLMVSQVSGPVNEIPWYLSTWGHLIFGAIFFSVAYLFYWLIHYRRIKQLVREAQEKELAHAKEIKKAYVDLNNAQAQLIHAEKMASLGELTAGIAHEIQNPLNFVNNFSEVSGELLSELKEELTKGDIEEAQSISDNVIQNLEKINEHGKRASSIVKGMLAHSRANADVKVLTNINDLCDEYLRLSYHGLRAKDKSFNSKYETKFDNRLPDIKIVTQDIGRVLLNLLNNAFYAVDSKSKQKHREGGKIDYEPLVSIETKERNGSILITIEDNGEGIPDEDREKIFQPFFTTKPTGSGTGLGLSISYDIITKGHGGSLALEPRQNIEGTKFIITIPFDG